MLANASAGGMLNGLLNQLTLPSRQGLETAPPGMSSRQPRALAPAWGQVNGGLADMLPDAALDQVELSPETAFSLRYARAQFQVNYQVIRSINTANGTETQQFSFSFHASVEYLQATSGQAPADLGAAVEGAAGADPLQRLRAFFSPEKTAERILDFALSFFPLSSHFKEGGDIEDNRQAFADFIGKAIQKGFDEALGILGKLPDPVQENIDQTHKIVFDGLQDFVQNGLAPAKVDAGGIYATIQAYRLEITARMEYRIIENYQTEDQNPGRRIGAAVVGPGDALDMEG